MTCGSQEKRKKWGRRNNQGNNSRNLHTLGKKPYTDTGSSANPSRINTKKTTNRHLIFELLKMEDEREIVNTAGKKTIYKRQEKGE